MDGNTAYVSDEKGVLEQGVFARLQRNPSCVTSGKLYFTYLDLSFLINKMGTLMVPTSRVNMRKWRLREVR